MASGATRITTGMVLRRAAEIWSASPTVNALARDADGFPTSPTAPQACSWCIEGARRRAAAELSMPQDTGILIMVRVAQALVRGVDLHTEINDFHPSLVPDLWSEAIEGAEALERDDE